MLTGMGRHDDHPLTILALELAPALLFAASVGFAVSVWTNEPLVVNAPLLAAAAAFVSAFSGLRQLGSPRRGLELPMIESEPVADEQSFVIPADMSEAEHREPIWIEGSSDEDLAAPVSDESVIASASDLLARIGGRPLETDAPEIDPLPDPDRDIAQVLDELRRALR